MRKRCSSPPLVQGICASGRAPESQEYHMHMSSMYHIPMQDVEIACMHRKGSQEGFPRARQSAPSTIFVCTSAVSVTKYVTKHLHINICLPRSILGSGVFKKAPAEPTSLNGRHQAEAVYACDKYILTHVDTNI